MLVFDTLEYTKKLTATGVPQEQAEVHAETMKQIIEHDLATKADILRLEKAIEDSKAELKRDLEDSKADLKRDLKEMEMRLIIRLGGLLVIGIGILASLEKLL
ncbi:MAG: DUF1640 domain-containing protein [SAR324 cluster bacterium]|nr:DUF1640 domain-containing protein [SAR324 cluster bacterium]